MRVIFPDPVPAGVSPRPRTALGGYAVRFKPDKTERIARRGLPTARFRVYRLCFLDARRRWCVLVRRGNTRGLYVERTKSIEANASLRAGSPVMRPPPEVNRPESARLPRLRGALL